MSSTKSNVLKYIPALESLRDYNLGYLRRDVFSGLTVAAVAVPQAMAYAKIFEMPPQYGLYTAIVMTTVGALLDSSKQLINGPTNAISIAMMSAMAAASVPSDQWIATAIMMALLIGTIQTSIALLRFGDLSRFVSHAVIVGFTLGASVLLLLNQIPKILGLPKRGGTHDPAIVQFFRTITEAPGIHWPTAAVGVSTIVFALLFRWANKRFKIGIPELLSAIGISALLVVQFDPGKVHGIKLIDPIPSALPSFQLPTISFQAIRELAGSATAIAFLGLLEAIAMAKSIANKTGEKLDMNQQCLSEGLANFVGGFFQCFPGSGSLTRSYINHISGAATQWSGVFSAVGVAIAVLILAPYAAYIPDASLAGVLVLTATRMTDLKALRYHLKATRFDAVILVATALSAILISVEYCILIGVLMSFAFYVAKAAHISVGELMVTADRVIREIKPTDTRCTKLRIYNVEGELFFGSAPDFEKNLERIESECSENSRVIILRLKRARNPDAVCLHLMQKFIEHMHELGIVVMLSGVSDTMYKSFENVGIVKLVREELIFREEAILWVSTISAMKRAYEIIGNDRCPHCPNEAFATKNHDDWSYMI